MIKSQRRGKVRAAAFLLAVSFLPLSLAAINDTPAMAATVVVGGDVSDGGKEVGPSMSSKTKSFQADRFVLPENARVLVVVEGTGDCSCQVYAYERTSPYGTAWTLRVSTPGNLGNNGMSNHRTEGDKTTPIGVFQMNTPFGQADPSEGFPVNYIKVDENYVWEARSNQLKASSSEDGELVGTKRYAGYYDYVIDAGYNKYAVEKKGSALFLHCSVNEGEGTSGCVAIPREQMAAVMRLYGTYGDGTCYIAQAPKGTFHQIYNSYGVNNGLSPDGNF